MNTCSPASQILASALMTVSFVAVITQDAFAQQTPARRWDASAVAGLLISHAPDVPGATYSDDWNPTGTSGFTVGRYLTPHVKTEAEFLFSGHAKRYINRFVVLPGIETPYPVGSEEFRRLQGVAGTVGWQFFENQWVHPTVFGGAEVDFERTRVHTWEQIRYSGDPRLPPTMQTVVAREHVDGPETTSVLRGVAGIAAKLYVARHAFVRTDARVALGRQGSGHLAFRVGFGADW